MADVEETDQVDEELVDSMGKLQEIQDELEKAKEEERSRVLEVKRKYNEVRRPLYKRRNELIQSISGFWVTAFLSHPVLANHVSEEDKKIFKYMVSLEVEDFKDVEPGYSITFNFSPNPFFEGEKLIKTFSFSEDGTTKITCTTIKWKDDKNIAGGSAQENKGAKPPVPIYSFFSWFGEEQQIVPIGVTDVVAVIIKEELWSDPLNYFSNEGDEEDFNEGGNDDDDNDDDEEEDEEDFNRSRSRSNDDDNDYYDKLTREVEIEDYVVEQDDDEEIEEYDKEKTEEDDAEQDDDEEEDDG